MIEKLEYLIALAQEKHFGRAAELCSVSQPSLSLGLKQLEEAGLVVTKRRGREKLHFLNPVPIRLVHDRVVSKYAEPWAASLNDIKRRLEDDDGKGVRDLHQDDP